MFISKINGPKFQTFKGYNHEIDENGKHLLRFNFPYDYDKIKDAQIEFYKLRNNEEAPSEYILEDNKPIVVKLDGSKGTAVDITRLANFSRDSVFGYRFIIGGKPTIDSGLVRNVNGQELNIVTQIGTTPLNQGLGVLIMPKTHRPGAQYLENGEIHYSYERQKEAEESTNTFSATPGGSLAGVQYDIKSLSKAGYSFLFLNPVVGADSLTHHGYSAENNFQLAPQMGTAENYNSFIEESYKYGMTYVYDATVASEGLLGNQFKYALRWHGHKPQTYYQLKIRGIKNGPLELGVIPNHCENLRHKIINKPVIYNPKTNSFVKNPQYNPNEKTIIQIYDKSRVTPEQEVNNEIITEYKKLKPTEALDINTHNDTTLPYHHEISAQEYIDRLERFIEYKKDVNNNTELNSPEGTMLIAQFSNFVYSMKKPGGYVAWDANTDLVKKSFHYSTYDEKLNQSLIEAKEQDLERDASIIGSKEVQDMSIRAGVYWTQTSKDVQTLYTAKVLGDKKDQESIIELVEKNLLPIQGLLSEDQLENAIYGDYELEQKTELSHDEVLFKSLMKLPLETLEFDSDVVQALSTSYFTNNATTEETIGLSRFELMQQNNPHLIREYEDLYIDTNNWFKNQIKTFAEDIIQKIDDESSEKLIKENGDYTEYGEYVLDLFGKTISKYAFLKSLAGEAIKPRILADGQISYDYKNIKQKTTLKALGINAGSPKEEAEILAEKISEGLDKLNEADIDFVSKAILSQIKGTNTVSFRIAEAMVANAGIGLGIRLDAAKDVIDMDAVRNRELTFDEAWDLCIDFWTKYAKAIKSVNPTSYIVAEMTDVDQLIKHITGSTDNPSLSRSLGIKYPTAEDALISFYNKTGITSEAGYSYTFTDLLKTFALDFEAGWGEGDKLRPSKFITKIHDLIEKRGLDFTRNLFTFADNHDKPSVLHGMALDMRLFFNSFDIFNDNGDFNLDFNKAHRHTAMQILANTDRYEDLPLELQLNIDNPEYFETVSSRAVAMGKLFKDIVNEDLTDIASEKEIELLNKAIQNLTNGNYLGQGKNTDFNTITIPELKTLEAALKSIMELGNFNLSQEQFNAVINRAKDKNLMEQFTVYGDFNWQLNGKAAADKNKERLGQFISGEDNLLQYSTYTVALAALLKAALESELGFNETHASFLKGGKAFIEKFNRKVVQESSKSLPIVDDPVLADRKNMFGAKDFETVIRLILEEAKYIDSQSNGGIPSEKFKNYDEILSTMFKSSTEPAVSKALMYMSYLSAMPGIATAYLRTIYGALGFDDKTKNISLQNRNVTPFAQLEQGPLKDVRQDYYNRFVDAMSLRNRDGVTALNSGTPYKTYAGVYIFDKGERVGNKDVSSDIPSYMMHDAYGNMTISIFNSIGLSNLNRFVYAPNIDTKKIKNYNKYVPILSNYTFDYINLDEKCSLPENLEFTNSDRRDEAIYITKRLFGNITSIIRKDGQRINISETAKNGVMLLKRFVGHPRVKKHLLKKV